MTLTIKDHGFWTPYKPSPAPRGLDGAMFCHRESDGMDWYEFVREKKILAADTVKITVMKMGPRHVVQAASRDASLLFPQNCLLLEVTGIDDADPLKTYGQREYDPGRKEFGLPIPPFAVTDRQLFQALAERGVISEDDALAAVTRGELPPAMQTFLDSIKGKREQFAARMLLAGGTMIERYSPTINGLWAALGMNEDATDELFRAADKL